MSFQAIKKNRDLMFWLYVARSSIPFARFPDSRRIVTASPVNARDMQECT
jgi:hypothetical protein